MDRWSTTCLRDDRPIGMTTRVVSTVPDFRRTRADGGYPDSDLVMDRAGHLYGTTVEGGLGSGTMFLTHSGSIWALRRVPAQFLSSIVPQASHSHIQIQGYFPNASQATRHSE